MILLSIHSDKIHDHQNGQTVSHTSKFFSLLPPIHIKLIDVFLCHHLNRNGYFFFGSSSQPSYLGWPPSRGLPSSKETGQRFLRHHLSSAARLSYLVSHQSHKSQWNGDSLLMIAAKAPIADRSFRATRVSTFPLTARTYGQRAWRSPSDPWFLVPRWSHKIHVLWWYP